MNPAGSAIAALRHAKATKDSLVSESGPGTDLALTLELLRQGLSLGLAYPAGHQTEVLAELSIIISLSDADQAIMVAEAYAWRSGDPPPYTPHYGDLAQWFADGEPNTTECLQVLSAHRDGRVDVLQATYSYVGDAVVWGDCYDLSETGGEMANMLLAGFEMQKERESPPLTPEQICFSLNCNFIVPIFVVPPRNRPCPCGSGDKAKHCCWSATR